MAIPEDAELADCENLSPHYAKPSGAAGGGKAGAAAAKPRRPKAEPVRDSFACFPNEAIYDDSVREEEDRCYKCHGGKIVGDVDGVTLTP